MRREVLEDDLKRLYSANDMVKADCGGCKGCSQCCQGMGESVVLDPLDVYRLKNGLNQNFAELMEFCLELNMVDGLVLPNLRMTGEQEQCCFLNEEGRCSIHSVRPGVCRLFPLGRIYENGSFKYFLQSQECPKANKSKIKVSKWMDTPDLKKYEEFVTMWHYFLVEAQELMEHQKDEKLDRDLTTYILNHFYVNPYPTGKDFYEEFSERYQVTKKLLKVLSK